MGAITLDILNLLRKIYRKLKKLRFRPLHKPMVKEKYLYLGSDYGGWPVVPGRINSSTVLYSFGVGADISFDLGMIDRFECETYAFDPTPKSIDWVASQTLPEQFHFYPVGIGDYDGEVEFFPPVEEDHVSFSMSPTSIASETGAIFAPILRLATIMSTYDLPEPGIIKMDIEGFEYSVIEDLVSSNIRPELLLIEFHHGMYEGVTADNTIQSVMLLVEAGYAIFYVSDSGQEYGLLKI
jgi:FkbM family methyltransferase|tara:strand:+ start:4228 stop:4944 length:717 start_codon:yes stop_codon:yes gene_type:complete